MAIPPKKGSPSAKPKPKAKAPPPKAMGSPFGYSSTGRAQPKKAPPKKR